LKKYILSIDAGTTGITLLLFNKDAQVVKKAYSEFTQHYPKAGWVEHDAEEIWQTTLLLFKEITDDISISEIASIGITNQRETTVVWDKNTSTPVYNAIVWQCRRTSDICEALKNKGHSNLFREKTGLVLDSYFSGTKIKWILDYLKESSPSISFEDLHFGTIDTWLVWKLTNGKYHVTDFTNASRTLIFNIHKKEWDDDLLKILDIPKSILPQVQNSASNFGHTCGSITNEEIPICGIAGDQQAALYGQLGFNDGDTKCTYGTGCFMLTNIGNNPIQSNHGLLTTLACDSKGNPVYALEGSVFIGGAVIQWLRDELKLISHASETEAIATSIEDSNGVYIIPAFVGLGAPYWDMNSRGSIFGLTRGTNRKHIIRAALESIAYQVSDLYTSILNDIDSNSTSLRVDGGATQNNFLMQFQADILNKEIVRPKNIETTALGSALLAGLGSGFWKSPNGFSNILDIDKKFNPSINHEERSQMISGWNDAINRTLTKG
jgi:glycerol kinase